MAIIRGGGSATDERYAPAAPTAPAPPPSDPAPAGTKSTARGTSTGSGGDKPTDEQTQAAVKASKIASFNAQTVRDEAIEANRIYGEADKQSRLQAAVQRIQNSKMAAGERFGAQKNMQMSAQQLFANGGAAMMSSGAGGMAQMLRSRADMDQTDVYDTLRGNQEQVDNEMNKTLNDNAFARMEMLNKARGEIRGIEGDTSAQLANIHPDFFQRPGTGDDKASITQNFLSGASLRGVKPPKTTPPSSGGYIRPD